MATAQPFAYNTGPQISGTQQVGDLSYGFPTTGFTDSPQYWNGPDENLGYVIGTSVPSNTQPTPVSGKTASVGFWRSEFLTENSFVELSNSLFNQNFTGGTEAKTWLNANGYWTSYKDVYRYDPLTLLAWPASSTGYTLYNGGFTGPDDGTSNSPITLPTTFETNNQASTNLFLSTNGYFTIGVGDSQIRNSPDGANPATMAANPGDNWMQPGLTNSDGDVQNWYYKTGTDGGGKFYVKNLVYAGIFPAASSTTPSSYIINFYRDEVYEWLETRVKSNVRGSAGPYNSPSVAQGASTTSRVWRGDLNGQNWVYMGTGSVQI
jgi:hypothetical protein